MMRKIITGAALLGLAFPAAAQFRIEGSIGRHFQVQATFADPCYTPPRHVVRTTGHWANVCEDVYVPGCFREEQVPPRYGWVSGRWGHRHWAVIEPGCCRQVWVPAHYEQRTRRVWVAC
jgi:hypothetical protein